MFLFWKRKDRGNEGTQQDTIPRTLLPTEVPKMLQSMSYHVGNMQGVGTRARQEDAFAFTNVFDVNAIREEGMLFVLCDGMGGMKDGKIASETAIACIRDSFAGMDRFGDIATQLKESVYRASSEVERLLDGVGGSTVIAGIIYHDQLYYASVGDSYLYMKRNNHLYRLNMEHNVCNQIYLESIQDGNLDPQYARNDSEAAALTQFLGMTGLSEVDGSVRPLPIRDGDVFLACSDGVGDVLDTGEVLCALGVEEPSEMCERLEQGIIAHNRPNQDNYTALVIKCAIV